MRPKICVPIVAPIRDGIIREAKQIAKLPVEMVEWRIDFFAGYEREILDVITELKRVLNEKELLVTIRTVAEGGEKNGSRFDYFETIRKILEQQTADYVDVEAARDEEKVKAVTEKEDFNENDSYVVAVPKNKVALKQHIAYYYPQWKLVDCDTINEAANMVVHGKVDCFIKGSSQVLKFDGNKNFKIISLTKTMEACFGVKDGQATLLSI